MPAKKTTTARKTEAPRSAVRTKKPGDQTAITPREYGGLQTAYDHFNRALFDGELRNVMITYQRKANSAGYFSPNRFALRVVEGGEHELALNPDGFIGQSDVQVLQTLVHEQSHVWQETCGTPASRGYHNKQWAAKMKSIGLMPSSTGMVGGRETGQRMQDYPIPGGRFLKACDDLFATGWKLNLQSAARAGGTKAPKQKTKYTCPSCGLNLWGNRQDANVNCNPCGCVMPAERPASQSYDQQAAE
jgi:hypothetical protein